MFKAAGVLDIGWVILTNRFKNPVGLYIFSKAKTTNYGLGELITYPIEGKEKIIWDIYLTCRCKK